MPIIYHHCPHLHNQLVMVTYQVNNIVLFSLKKSPHSQYKTFDIHRDQRVMPLICLRCYGTHLHNYPIPNRDWLNLYRNAIMSIFFYGDIRKKTYNQSTYTQTHTQSNTR